MKSHVLDSCQYVTGCTHAALSHRGGRGVQHNTSSEMCIYCLIYVAFIHHVLKARSEKILSDIDAVCASPVHQHSMKIIVQSLSNDTCVSKSTLLLSYLVSTVSPGALFSNSYCILLRIAACSCCFISHTLHKHKLP